MFLLTIILSMVNEDTMLRLSDALLDPSRSEQFSSFLFLASEALSAMWIATLIAEICLVCLALDAAAALSWSG